jgi:hypothetical protein
MNETVLQLIKNTNLIEYIPGQMGTFLHAFLETHPTIDILRKRREYNIPLVGIGENKEWQMVSYLYTNQCKEFDDMFTDREFYDRYLIYTKIVQQYMRTIVKDETYNKPLFKYIRELQSDDLQIIEREELDLSNQVFEYHRSHRLDHILVDKNILPWKNRIYAIFPKNKFWISMLLLLYKHQFHPSIDNKEIASIWAKNAVTSIIDHSGESSRTIQHEMGYLYNFSNFRRYELFNIYDLIFNKNIDNLHSIATPKFQFNDHKKQMLNSAHQDGIDILNFYGLSPDINVPLEDTFKFLSTNKLVLDSINYSKK